MIVFNISNLACKDNIMLLFIFGLARKLVFIYSYLVRYWDARLVHSQYATIVFE